MNVRHLVNISAYDFDLQRLGGHDGIRDLISRFGIDGTEMLTGHFQAPLFKDVVTAVHLPYAADWYNGWRGVHELDGLSDEECLFLCYGRWPEDIPDTIETMIRLAAPLDPAYGVLHAASPDLYHIFSQNSGFSDREVLENFCEILNTVVSRFHGGEPPFSLALENLWWPGLRLLERSEVSLLERHLEFERWSLCLDTGHMMNALRNCYDEGGAVEAVESALDRLGDDVIQRISCMHLHMSLSAEYQKRCVEMGEPETYLKAGIVEKLSMAYPHFSKMDSHSPFTNPACRHIVERVSPDFVTHEFISPEIGSLETNLRMQLAHFR